MMRRHWLALASCAVLFHSSAGATAFGISNLVSDDGAINAAPLVDASLVNPWGLSYAASSPFWVSNNGAGNSTLYSVNPVTQAVSKVGLTVSIAGDGSVTGQTFIGGSGGFDSNAFAFVSEDGTVSGWRGALGTQAEVLATASDSNVYKGVATGAVGNNHYLYAANFRSGAIDVMKASAAAPALAGNFLDPNLPAGYAPFNITSLADSLFVSYAVQGSGRDDAPGAGHGIVNQFDFNGLLLRRFASGGSLDSPWGMAIAPASFGALAGSLLVGNFGDGHINSFDLASGQLLGQLADGQGNTLAIDGLWGLVIGNDGNAGSSQSLYFTAGPQDESHGLFGVINPAPVPLPAPAVLLGAASCCLLWTRRRANRR